MKPIKRSRGTTETEQYLAELADKTFLDLWSYPNTYIDKKVRGGSDGKELCDLLVVCGNDVIIFSDKSISWPEHSDSNVSWSRWFKRAIQHSVDQIRGAERWLRLFPTRVFLDSACTQPLPVQLPLPSIARVYGVAIALGAGEACKKFYRDPDGSLMVFGPLKGEKHIDASAPEYMPFAVGDVDPTGPFIHVFDKDGLDLVLREMDTILDFTRYLREREKFIRHGRMGHSPSEAEMIYIYLHTLNDNGEHAFPHPSDYGGTPDMLLTLAPGMYEDFTTSRMYIAKKQADEVSYYWDRLIGIFTEHVLAGTSVSIQGELPSAALAEPALRIMAREPRVIRRMLGGAFFEALQKAALAGQDRYARIVMPIDGAADPECGYVFLILSYPKRELEGGYEQYRRTRVALLDAYCFSVLNQHRNLKRIVGVAVDGPAFISGREERSEDLLAIEIDVWTPELEEDAKVKQSTYDLLSPQRLKSSERSVREYPYVPSAESESRDRSKMKKARKARQRRKGKK